jgi:hypothetical protein
MRKHAISFNERATGLGVAGTQVDLLPQPAA